MHCLATRRQQRKTSQQCSTNNAEPCCESRHAPLSFINERRHGVLGSSPAEIARINDRHALVRQPFAIRHYVGNWALDMDADMPSGPIL